MLGSGEARYESFFTSLQQRFPDRVVFHRGYSEELAHLIEAASDMFLMPSLYEPCGLNQMYSLKYGTAPIVRRTGGLADSVQHWDPATRRGTGIVFNDYDAPAVRWALHTALDLFKDRDSWQQMMRNGDGAGFLVGPAEPRVRAALRAASLPASTLRLTVPVSWNGIFFSMRDVGEHLAFDDVVHLFASIEPRQQPARAAHEVGAHRHVEVDVALAPAR